MGMESLLGSPSGHVVSRDHPGGSAVELCSFSHHNVGLVGHGKKPLRVLGRLDNSSIPSL